MLRRLRSRLLVALLLACALAPAAAAETVRLADGKALEVESVAFRDDHIEVAMQRDGGTARIVLRFEKLDAADILPLWDRLHDHEDAAAILASADLALRLGLHGEAANRFEVASRLNPDLMPQRDAGLARIRALEADAAVADVEHRVREGQDLRGAVTLARALLEDSPTDALPEKQRRRIEALAALAEKLAAREAAREAKAAGPVPEPTSDPAPPAPQDAAPVEPAADGALAAIRHRIGAFVVRADLARESAASVTITNRQSIRHLETAADAYLLARRMVREAPAHLAEALALIGDDLRLALVTTYLDLADLYRQEGRFDEARARVRAALILDPGNEHAWEQRRLIEDDLRSPPLPLEAERVPMVGFTYWRGVPGYPCRRCWGYPRPVPYGGVSYFGSRVHFGFGAGPVRVGGTRRLVGRRR